MAPIKSYTRYTITELQTLLQLYTDLLNEYINDELSEFNTNIIAHFQNELLLIQSDISIYNISLPISIVTYPV